MLAKSITQVGDGEAVISPDYGRELDATTFLDSKTGVRGLVESGLKRVPGIFFLNSDERPEEDNPVPRNSPSSIPVIDLGGVNQDAASHSNVVRQIRNACEEYGFFQVVNHGVPVLVMDKMIDTVRLFHEQDPEKRRAYCRPKPQQFRYLRGNIDPSKMRKFSWLDSFYFETEHFPPVLEELPAEFRNPIIEYTSYITTLGTSLFGLFSEALGLETNHLQKIGCAEGLYFLGHYYPPCPEPELTLGAQAHSDILFLNMLLQDHVGGLQVLHKNESWVDVHPFPGALVVNMGDMMQLITNGKFKSSSHRVLAKKTGPRISVASFMKPVSDGVSSRIYGPIKELLSEDNPPIYRATTIEEYTAHHYSNFTMDDQKAPLLHFKL